MNPLGQTLMTRNGAGIHITRPETAMGNAGQHNIWTIAGGSIMILSIWGVILTTLMDVTLSTLRLEHSLGNVNLCGDLAAIADDPVGTVYYLEGIQASLLVKADATAGVPTTIVAGLTAIAAVAGNICCTNGGNQTGTVEWHMVYAPLDPVVSVINALVYG